MLNMYINIQYKIKFISAKDMPAVVINWYSYNISMCGTLSLSIFTAELKKYTRICRKTAFYHQSCLKHILNTLFVFLHTNTSCIPPYTYFILWDNIYPDRFILIYLLSTLTEQAFIFPLFTEFKIKWILKLNLSSEV